MKVESFRDQLVRMSEGNVGAVTFFMEVCEKLVFGSIIIHVLDQLELHGSKAWVFWKDVCKQDLQTVVQITDDWMSKKITKEEIQEMVMSAR